MAPLARIALPSLLWTLVSGCMQFSPFETDLDASERGHTAKNLQALGERQPPDGPWRLAVISDSHSSYDELAELVEILNAREDLELVLHAGDVTDFGLRQEYLWTLERLRELDMPWLTVIGNHDTLSNGTEIYRKMFGPYDYAFDWGSVRFVCFNSNHPELGGNVPNWEFVEAEAVAAEDGGIVLLTHVPPRALGASDQPRFARVLAQPRMLFSAHGHHHAPSHEWLAGVPAVTVGTSEGLHHVVATIDGARAELELCSDRTCKPLEPEP